MGSAVRRRCPRGPDPPPEGRMPQPAGACEGVPRRDPLRADRCPRGFQWGQLDGHVAVPRCAGASPPWPGARFAPSSSTRLHPGAPCGRRWTSRGRSLPPCPGPCPRRCGGRRAVLAGVNRAIWLILPVVICLSQRLSHACLSISNLYCETANGSLNQLSFI